MKPSERIAQLSQVTVRSDDAIVDVDRERCSVCDHRTELYKARIIARGVFWRPIYARAPAVERSPGAAKDTGEP